MRTMTSRFCIKSCSACGGTHPKGTEITKRRGEWVPVSCTGGTPTTRRQRTTVAAVDTVRAEMERGAAALERAAAADPYEPKWTARPALRVVPPVPSECAECGGTKLGDDGFECATCAPDEQTPPHADDFGPMPTDEDFAAADAALPMDTEGGAS